MVAYAIWNLKIAQKGYAGYLSATPGNRKTQNIWTSYNVFNNLLNIADFAIFRKSQFLLLTIFLVILAFNIYKAIVIMSVGHLTNIAS